MAVNSSASPVYIRTSSMLELAPPKEGTRIHYTINGSTPTAPSNLYKGPIRIDPDMFSNNRLIIRAAAFDKEFRGLKGKTLEIEFRLLQ